jgi:predicted hydrolase (HD superfamily)
VTALLHDFDFEIHPTLDKHPMHGEPILAGRGVPDEVRRAILSHDDYSGVPRESLLEKALFACDELSGFISATALVRPSRNVADVDAGSVKRKMQDKAFARAVNRGDIVKGAAELNVPLEEHIEFCIRAMQARAAELGLAG